MTVYIVVFVVISICAVASCGRMSQKARDFLYWGCAVVLIVLSAIRDFSVGADTLNYCRGYKDICQLSFGNAMKYGWEPAYVALNWLLGIFFDDERALLVFMAFFVLLPIFIWIKKESKWPLLSLVIFIGMGMWNSSMFILRQWCAMAILTYSYRYIKERRFLPFALLVIIAMLFHRTAAIFFLAYFVSDIPLNKTTIILSLPFSVAVGLMGPKILNILNHFARIGEAGNFNGGVSMLIVLWLCVFSILICFKGKIPKSLSFYCCFVFFAAFSQPIAFAFSNWSRIIMYFSISLVVFLPNFVTELTGNCTKNRALRFPIGIVICFFMYIWFKNINADPYVFLALGR